MRLVAFGLSNYNALESNGWHSVFGCLKGMNYLTRSMKEIIWNETCKS